MTAPIILPYPDAPAPLDALERVAMLRHPVLLDGAAEPEDLGRWSYLMVEPAELLEGPAEEWPEARDRIRATRWGASPERDGPPFQGGWVGWLAYELGRGFDRQPLAAGATRPVPLADFSLGRYETLVAWDHLHGTAWLVGESEADCRQLRRLVDRDSRFEIGESSVTSIRESRVTNLPRANFTPDGYRAAVSEVIARVLAGDIFQANLSQQFVVPCALRPIEAYRALRQRAPGSHAAYLERDGTAILSMSPELFLRLDPRSRRAESRPIKGTRPRAADPDADAVLGAELVASAKDRAENVMIVDLVRNDLNRVAVPGSVAVPILCRLESHAAVHHLASAVTGTLRPDCDALDLLAATFPAGSITGAPKLRAMAILAELEPDRRGVYCGAIGWIGHDGGMELSVAIRTVTLAGGMAVVPAGGGVTALSEADAEYRETIDKARALLGALGAAP